MHRIRTPAHHRQTRRHHVMPWQGTDDHPRPARARLRASEDDPPSRLNSRRRRRPNARPVVQRPARTELPISVQADPAERRKRQLPRTAGHFLKSPRRQKQMPLDRLLAVRHVVGCRLAGHRLGEIDFRRAKFIRGTVDFADAEFPGEMPISGAPNSPAVRSISAALAARHSRLNFPGLARRPRA